jgi:alanine racemase
MHNGDEHTDANAEADDAGAGAGIGVGVGVGVGIDASEGSTVTARIPDETGRRPLTEAVIDLNAIAHNTRLLKKHSNDHLMAVVKGDGFGHGAVQVAQTTLANGATWLGVAHIDEALALRKAGLTAPTFAWMHPSDDDVTDALREDIDLSASSLGHLTGIAACAERMGILAAVHLKVDTGLHRNGASPTEWPALIRAATQFEEQGLVRIRGIWSHLAFSDDPTHPTTGRQIELFNAAVQQAEAAGLRPELLHLANSSAALTVPRTRYHMVRAGIALYGVEPVPGQTFGLRPAMTLRAQVIATREVPPGEGEDTPFGHLHTNTTDHPTAAALLPLGYMSGLPRAASNAAQVWLDGARRPIAGLIDMDQCVVDAGNAQVAIGDNAVFFGTGDQGEPTAAEWAHWANTNAQQVLTGLGIRVPRRYLPPTNRTAG